MKKLILKILVVLAGIVLLIPATSENLWAGIGKTSDETKIAQERMKEAESYLQSPLKVDLSFPEQYKIYDQNLRLIYETGSVQDQKLQSLLLKSDLIIEINNTHIFQLSR